MKLYNTFTRQKDELKPLNDKKANSVGLLFIFSHETFCGSLGAGCL